MPRKPATGVYGSPQQLTDAVWQMKFLDGLTHGEIAKAACVSKMSVTRCLTEREPSRDLREAIATSLLATHEQLPAVDQQLASWHRSNVPHDWIAKMLGVPAAWVEGRIVSHHARQDSRKAAQAVRAAQQIEASTDIQEVDLLLDLFSEACALIEAASFEDPQAQAQVAQYATQYADRLHSGRSMETIPHPEEFAGYLPAALQTQFKENVSHMLTVQ